MPRLKYGLNWNNQTSDLEIEFYMIRSLYHAGKPEKLLNHYLNAHKLLWPEEDQHRWFKLGMKSIIENKISLFLGSASSAKTHIMVVHALITYFTFKRNFLGMISSTTKQDMERRVWGRLKELFNRAKMRFDFIEGQVLESSMTITPDEVDDDGEFGRTLNRGITCVPCISGGRFTGMSRMQGAKPPNSAGKMDGIMLHYGDEAATMPLNLTDSYSNWMVSPNFKGVMCGNPTDISDTLCTAAEPVGGWDAFVDTGKTQEWTSRWYDAHVVAFDGRDSPNNDEPKNRYPYLISQDFVDLMRKTHGDDDWHFWQMAVGKPSRGMVSNRVITIGFCEQHKAFDAAIWKVPPPTKIGALDPAYGGGDRCVFMHGQIGEGLNGKQLLEITGKEIVPIRLSSGMEPEQQIAQFMFDRSQQLGIPPENLSYDSFGRGTLGFFFAELFGKNCPVPVNSGDNPTDRPVRFDYFVEDRSAPAGRRLKRCNEEYKKKITELWFSVRECIHSEQLKGLDKETAHEGQLRLFHIKNSMIELETKDDMKERVKKSPDLFDACAILCETARRIGFQISRIGEAAKPKVEIDDFFDTEAKKWDSAIKSGLLKY